MHGLLIPLASILTGVGLLIVGVGLLFSLLGLRGTLSDFSSVTTGLIMSAYFAGYILGIYICPTIVKRVGHIRAFAAMASVSSTMPILHAIWVDPWFWGVLRLITGICLVGLYLVIESWLNTLAPRQHRGKIFSLYMAVNFVALAIGQMLILAGNTLGFIPFVLISILFSFALLPITLTPVRDPESIEPPRLDLKELYRISPLGVGGALASGLLYGAFYGMGAAYAQGIGLSDFNVAAFMAATILGGAIFQWPVGHYSDRHDRRYVLLWVCIGSAILAVIGFFVSVFSENALIALGVLYGGFVFSLYGLSVAHVHDLVDVTRVLEVTGGLLLIHGVGAAAGPTLAGLMMDALNPESLMLYFALILAVLSAFTVRRIGAAPAVPESEKSEYLPMTGGSPAAVNLNPIAEIPEPAADDQNTNAEDADKTVAESEDTIEALDKTRHASDVAVDAEDKTHDDADESPNDPYKTPSGSAKTPDDSDDMGDEPDVAMDGPHTKPR